MRMGTPLISAFVADFARTGKLTVALTERPSVVAKADPATGTLTGVGVDFGRALAARLGVTFTPLGFASPSAAVAAVGGGIADIAIVPLTAIDPKSMTATTPILLIQHTHMVPRRFAAAVGAGC
jgi:polar amino acid transport system substrate-binding protein